MPALHFHQGCMPFQSPGNSGICSDIEASMRKPEAVFPPPAVFDTPDSLDCTNIHSRPSMFPISTTDCAKGVMAANGPSLMPFDNIRAIVNIRITTDTVPSNFSILDSMRPVVLDSAVRDTSSSLTSNEKAAPQLSAPSFPQSCGQPDAASALRILHSLDPSIYSIACEPLGHWVADHVWKVTTQGLSLPLAFVASSPNDAFPSDPLPVLAESITSLLLSTLIQPSAIILSLYYIARLPAYIGTTPFHSLSSDSANRFNKLLLSTDMIAQEGPVVQALYASFKLFVLGVILSNKVLDDHVFTMKTWHDVSGIPLKVLNELERLSLDILSHELFLPPAAWHRWVQMLYTHHLSMRTPHHSQTLSLQSYCMVRHMLEGLILVKDSKPTSPRCANSPTFLGLDDRIAAKYSAEDARAEEMIDDFEMDHDGPLREEYLPKRRTQEDSSELHPSYFSVPQYDSQTLAAPLSHPCNPISTYPCHSRSEAATRGFAPNSGFACEIPTLPPTASLPGPVNPCGYFDCIPQNPVATTLCEYFLSYSRIRIY